jgi:hypothetical protein
VKERQFRLFLDSVMGDNLLRRHCTHEVYGVELIHGGAAAENHANSSERGRTKLNRRCFTAARMFPLKSNVRALGHLRLFAYPRKLLAYPRDKSYSESASLFLVAFSGIIINIISTRRCKIVSTFVLEISIFS